VIQLSNNPLTKTELAQRVASDIPNGSYVNLGIGLPTMVSNFISSDSDVILHTENGMLGMGPEAGLEQIDNELINAGKIPVTELLGASYFHHADSFAMIRGGHIDICVLGAFQVSFKGDLSNWHAGDPDDIPSVGGAMDLASGATSTFVMMTLFDKDGKSKLVESCSAPLTALRCVTRIYSDFAVMDITSDGVEFVEVFGQSEAQLRDRIGLS
jgi:3-oxoadipate CoA-transferase beta subunit